tara:strand:- start:1957 stop:2247 length:291 start_codon:yes stop_codon:yes gene_type:complete
MLHKLFESFLGAFGYIPDYRENLLIQEILLLERQQSALEKENLELKDENASLWHMLDEIKKSDISEHQGTMKLLMEELKETLTDEMMKDFKPIGEA